MEAFLQFLKWRGQNKIILWNFGNLAFKWVFLLNEGLGLGVVGKLIFRAECNFKNFGLY